MKKTNHKDSKTPRHKLEEYFNNLFFVTSCLGDLVVKVFKSPSYCVSLFSLVLLAARKAVNRFNGL